MGAASPPDPAAAADANVRPPDSPRPASASRQPAVVRVFAGLAGAGLAPLVLAAAAMTFWVGVSAATRPDALATAGELSSPPANWSESAELVTITLALAFLTGLGVMGAASLLRLAFGGAGIGWRRSLLWPFGLVALTLVVLLVFLFIVKTDLTTIGPSEDGS